MATFSILIRRKTVYFFRHYGFLLIGISVICLFYGIFTSGKSNCNHTSCQHVASVPYVKQLEKTDLRKVPKKRILAWTGFFSDVSWEGMHDDHFQTCKVKTCTFTTNRDMFHESDAILFHVGALTSVISSLDLPSSRHPFQRWVLYNIEPPPRSLLGFTKLAGVFNWTAWYRTDSDIPVLYGGITQYSHSKQLKYLDSSENYGLKNTRLAAWMSSNCHDYGRRQLFIRDMKRHLGDRLDLYGGCGTRPCPETTCQDTISNYKFFFAIENTNCKDYITEKFWSALRRHQVPIVTGNRGYEKVAPPHSYINADDFPNTKALSDYMVLLSNNQTEYNKYLKWTEQYDVYSEIQGRRRFWCDLCEALHNNTRPNQVYTNLDGWVNSEDSNCPQFTLLNWISRQFDAFRIKYGLM